LIFSEGVIYEIMIRAACSGRENTDSYVGNCKLANVSATKVTMKRNAPDFVGGKDIPARRILFGSY